MHEVTESVQLVSSVTATLFSFQRPVNITMSAFSSTPIPVSIKAKRTHNPIRAIVDNLMPPKDHP